MKTKYSTFVVVLLLLMSILSACTAQSTVQSMLPNAQVPSVDMKVHFIDVGQGDCTLIQLADGKNILIDGGNRADSMVITKYLKSHDVKTIDYLIATHPHEDHIGSLPDIIKNFEIGNIYMPKVTANTRIFENLLQAIKAKDYKINTAVAGVKIIDSNEINLTVIAPNSSEYDELNNYSAVVKLTYLNTSFLFTGDAEDVSEREILKTRFDIKADVIKIGHHGGRTSTTTEFLAKVSPKYAVISVGKDNDYGHPHIETLDRLNASKLQVFRTDEQGTIVASSDGRTVTLDKAPIISETKQSTNESFYIGNKNSKVFHRQTCSGLPAIENQIKLTSKEEAQNAGYKPCQRCKP